MRAGGLPGVVDWTRFRTMGVDLLIVGVLVVLVALGFAFYTVCPSPGACQTAVDVPTLLPGLTFVALGAFLTVMSRRQKTKTG